MKQMKFHSACEAIQHMKSRGITFRYISEDGAARFLENNNYYHKIITYCENYRKIQDGIHDGEYERLDFAYLKELSIIDMHLRYLLIQMCLDIEHHIKLTLIHDVSSNPQEDGYNIVNQFDPSGAIRKRVLSRTSSNYAYDLTAEYRESLNFPIWILCDLLTFGELCHLYGTYVDLYPGRRLPSLKLLSAIRSMRNSCAHNNCLLYRLCFSSRRGNTPVMSNIVSKIPTITKTSRKFYMNIIPIHDFVVVLYAYAQFVKSKGLKRKRKKDLCRLFHHRIAEHADYFTSNPALISAYQFCTRFLLFVLKKY